MDVLNSSPLMAPDWGLFDHIPTVGLEEAVALSLNVDPLFAQTLWDTFNDQDPLEHDEITIEFVRRLVIARNNIQPLGTLPVLGMDDTPPRCRVRLADFALWAANLGWALPREFQKGQTEVPFRELTPRPDFPASSDAVEKIGQQIRSRAAQLKKERCPAVIKTLASEFKRSESTIKKHLYGPGAK